MAEVELGKRQTFGEQLNANTEKQIRSPDRQEVGETMNEMGKDFLKELSSAISNARLKGVKGRIYVQVVEQPLQWGRNMVKHTFFVRKTRPTPDQSTYLYSHDEGAESPVFEYCLPEVAHLPFVYSHPQMFSRKYLQDITDWVKGKLK